MYVGAIEKVSSFTGIAT